MGSKLPNLGSPCSLSGVPSSSIKRVSEAPFPQSFWGRQGWRLHKECSLSAEVIYNWCDTKGSHCAKSASQARSPSLSRPTGAGSFPLLHRHRPGNKAARSSAVDIFSLFSTLLTFITSEAAVSLNENWKDLSHLSLGSAQEKDPSFPKAWMTLFLWVTPTQEKRYDNASRQRLVMGPSDLNHFSLALESTVIFFFFKLRCIYLPNYVCLCRYHTQTMFHKHGPRRRPAHTVWREGLACNHNFAIEVILGVDHPNPEHGETVTFQTKLSSSLCFCHPRLPNP